MKSFIGAVLFMVGMSLAYWSFDATADTEFDETENGYMGYDYDTGDFIEVTEDPTGGYDAYNYGTREYSDVEESSSGGFTIYSD